MSDFSREPYSDSYKTPEPTFDSKVENKVLVKQRAA